MPRRAAGPIITGIMLDPDAPVPLYRQVYEGFRAAILRRQLSPGARLPSTRTLARDLGISRYTVVEAFLQLLAEGYLSSPKATSRAKPAPAPTSRVPSRRSCCALPVRPAPPRRRRRSAAHSRSAAPSR